jgi:hypothetical protein
MITWCFDCASVILEGLKISGWATSSNVYKRSRKFMGWMIKFFAMYVAVKQERGRLIRWIYNNHYKQDSGQDSYNMFTGRSEVINDQPESVYFMDKFIQPTHLFLHSNPLDYPETAKAKGIKSSKEWE